jgi:hypothetical protein
MFFFHSIDEKKRAATLAVETTTHPNAPPPAYRHKQGGALHAAKVAGCRCRLLRLSPLDAG